MRTGSDGTCRSLSGLNRDYSRPSETGPLRHATGSKINNQGFSPNDSSLGWRSLGGSCKISDGLEELDKPSISTGQAATMLGVRIEFLRRLDEANAVIPGRSRGGHRRYSRRQLQLVARLRELLDQGLSLAASLRIIALEDDLATAQARIDELRSVPRPLTFGALTEIPADC